MNAILTPAAIPPPLPHVVVTPERDATTKAVLRYFEAAKGSDRIEHADAFDHLVAICSLAVQPYALHDRHGAMKVQPTAEEQGLVYSNIDGSRTGQKVRTEGDAVDATRQWIQEWLLGSLARHRGKSDQELIAAADCDDFRYLGKACRNRLIDATRTQKAKKNHRPPHVSLDTPIAEDGETLLDCIGTEWQSAPSSLATGTSFEEFLTCVMNVFRAVVANAAELERLDLVDGLRAMLGNAEHLERVSARRFDALVTQSIARRRGVSETSARAYKRRFHVTMERELAAGNPAVRAIFLELPTAHSGSLYAGASTPESGTPLDTSDFAEDFYRDHGCAWDEVEG
jgi:hypothetical protein